MSAWSARWPRDGSRGWQAMAPRPRIALVGLSALLAGALGYQMLYRPRAHALAKVRAEWQAAHQQVETMQRELPDIDQQRRDVEQMRVEVDRLRKDLNTLEGRLPSAADLGQVIQALATQAAELHVAFESIKQQLKDDAEYPEATVEMTAAAAYQDVVNFLRRVEHLSPFLRTAVLELAEPKGKEASLGAGQRMKLVLVTPLRTSTESGTWTLAGKADLPAPVTLSRSPFASSQRPVEAGDREVLNVAGITWRGASSTAIINDDVVRVGDRIGERTVSRIFPDKVVLSDGQELSPAAFE